MWAGERDEPWAVRGGRPRRPSRGGCSVWRGCSAAARRTKHCVPRGWPTARERIESLVSGDEIPPSSSTRSERLGRRKGRVRTLTCARSSDAPLACFLAITCTLGHVYGTLRRRASFGAIRSVPRESSAASREKCYIVCESIICTSTSHSNVRPRKSEELSSSGPRESEPPCPSNSSCSPSG